LDVVAWTTVTDETPVVPRMLVSSMTRRGKSVRTLPLLVLPAMVKAASPGSVSEMESFEVTREWSPGASEPLNVSGPFEV
jgi:hypothetical protein